MKTEIVDGAWQHVVQDLSVHPVALFPQESSERQAAQPGFEELLAQSQLLARAMGRIVRVNPDRSLDVIARAELVQPHNAYKEYRV